MEGITLLAALASVAMLLVWQILQLPVPFQLDYEEGNVLNTVSLIQSGQSIYPQPGRLPFVINPYPPLYYYLCAGGTALFGYSFLFGRVVSLLAMLSLAMAVGLGVLRRLQWPTAAVLAAAFFYLTIPARQWATLMRVDALAVALTVWGFYAAVFARRRHLAALLFVAALLTKHTMVAAPAAVMLAWWLEGRRREAAILAVELAVGVGVVFGLFGWWTGGAFYVYMFGIHGDPTMPIKWFYQFSFLVRNLPVVVALAVWLAVEEGRRWWRERAQHPAPDVVVIYFLSAVVTTFSGAKLGSSWNHYLEFWAVAGLAAGCAVERLRRQSTAPGASESGNEKALPRLWLWIPLVLQGLLGLPLMMPWNPGQWFHGAGAVTLAAGAGWCAYRVWRSRWAALLAAVTLLTFPGVYHWGLMTANLWPALLSILALALLIEGQAELAGLAGLAAAATGAALLPIAVPVAWVLLRGSRRGAFRAIPGLVFIALTLLIAGRLSSEPNLFHSSSSLPLSGNLLSQWLHEVPLPAALAVAALYAAPPRFLALYAAAALVFAVAFRDARLWLELGVALAILAGGVVRLKVWEAARAPAAAALLVQLLLLNPAELWFAEGYNAERLRKVYAAVAAAPDPIIAENVGLLSAARKPVLLSNPFIFWHATRYFPEELLLEKLRQGQIRLVVLRRDPTAPDLPGDNNPNWSLRFRETLKRHYRKSAEYDIGPQQFFFFVPAAAGPRSPAPLSRHRSSAADADH